MILDQLPAGQRVGIASWDVPGLEGVALNARMLRTGGQYADEANTLSLPTWNRLDAGARYAFKVDQKAVTLRLNVDNLTNKNYWASANGGYLTQGEPRLVKLTRERLEGRPGASYAVGVLVPSGHRNLAAARSNKS